MRLDGIVLLVHVAGYHDGSRRKSVRECEREKECECERETKRAVEKTRKRGMCVGMYAN